MGPGAVGRQIQLVAGTQQSVSDVMDVHDPGRLARHPLDYAEHLLGVRVGRDAMYMLRADSTNVPQGGLQVVERGGDRGQIMQL
ncbi:hypothetical protein SAMN02787144_1009133 [Streptomyces atratus]|uniref:Uncharacterized protein n=1 Tax=Streptomyces atratus TaxID=1893 RepID=A0A1K2BSB2_STRAR|nr:hypothetical protein SAMN02787144_1009133 [Streptomyces atratus]